MVPWFNRNGKAVFIVTFITMCLMYDIGRSLHQQPQPTHMWRQTDCLSITQNYYNGNWNFFEPRIHHQISDDGMSGKTAGEFPLLYYVIALFWSVFGKSEFIYRLFMLLLHFTASYALFLTAKRWLRGVVAPLFVALIAFTSPAIVYYFIGFLTDVPAFDLAIIGWYFMSRYLHGKELKHMYFGFVFFSLAALLKVTAGMSLLSVMIVFFIELLLPYFRSTRPVLFKSRLPAAIGIVLSLVAVWAWYAYAGHYNGIHGGKYTFNDIWPIWELSDERVSELWEHTMELLVFQVFDTSIWVFLGVSLIFFLTQIRKLPIQVIMIVLALIGGSILYTLLWFQAVESDHDYYFINPIISLVALIFASLWVLQHSFPKVYNSKLIQVGLIALLAYNGLYAMTNQKMRYENGGRLEAADLLPLFHEGEVEFWNGQQYYDVAPMLSISPALAEMGVGSDERVIYVGDQSINASLYLMNRRGNTKFTGDMSDPEVVIPLTERGATVILIQSWEADKIARLQALLGPKLGTHQGVDVYRLRPSI